MKKTILTLSSFCKNLIGCHVAVIGLLAFLPTLKAANTVYYNFDNASFAPTVVDVSGGGNDGLLTNTLVPSNGDPTFSIAQVYEGTHSILFANGGGSTKGQEILISNSLDLTGDFSFSMAVYPTALIGNGTVAFLFSKGANANGTANVQFGFYEFSSALHLYYSHTGASFSLISNEVVPLNTWSQLEVTSVGGTVTLLLNGATAESGLDSTPVTPSSFSSHIGTALLGASDEQGYKGYVDSFTFNYTPVPEPSTVALLGITGLGGVLFLRRRLKKV